MRWGNIPDEHMDMTVYAPDSSAAAVVLGEYGTVEFRQNLSMDYQVHRRIKILSEGGYNEANVEIDYVHGNNGQSLRRLDGQTFVKRPGGRVDRVRLDNSDIFREQDGNVTRVRFTLPAIEPGAVIEYRYTLSSPGPGYFPDWIFQDDVPVLHSEFRAQVPRYLVFNRLTVGGPQFAVQDIDEKAFDQREWAQFAGARSPQRRETFINTYRWVANEVPALEREDFVASRWDYAQAVRFQMSGYYDHNANFRPLGESWDDIARRLNDSEVFGRRYRQNNTIDRETQALLAGAGTEMEKAQAIYDFVRNSIVWNREARLGAERPLTRVLDSRSGSSAEINLLLVAMLRSAGISATPVVLSTRANGRVQTHFPSISQFNYVIVQATVDGQPQLMDATDPHRPINMLPIHALNHDGLAVSGTGFQWVALPPAPGTMSAIGFNGRIDPSGNVSGNVTGRLAGYSALRARHRMQEQADADADEVQAGQAVAADEQLRFLSMSVNGVDGDGAIVFSGEFEAPERVQVLGHLLNFNPVLQGGISEGPLRAPTRAYPVDFTHPEHRVFEGRFAIPAGYVVDELPSPVELVLPNQGGAFVRVIQVQGSDLVVQRQLVLGKHVFQPEEYEGLKAFYDSIADADAQTVVLVRSNDSPRAAPQVEPETTETIVDEEG